MYFLHNMPQKIAERLFSLPRRWFAIREPSYCILSLDGVDRGGVEPPPWVLFLTALPCSTSKLPTQSSRVIPDLCHVLPPYDAGEKCASMRGLSRLRFGSYPTYIFKTPNQPPRWNVERIQLLNRNVIRLTPFNKFYIQHLQTEQLTLA